MAIIVGIGWLIILCTFIVFFAAGAISQHEKKRVAKDMEDPYSYLFDIYEE
ncbi:hypothetical protein NM897_14645 [Planococcus maritimus]|uniref:hypothetical protein n=1 Tax=Planococcus maritimus TaxID=192421 RepID=UPI00313966C8